MHASGHLEVLTTGQSGRWMEALEEIGIYDFYHLPHFHSLSETRGDGHAVMAVYREGRHAAAFPMLIRQIDMPCAPEGLRDATSVNGFAGPVASGDMPCDMRERFFHELQDFLAQERIISVFSRLNPLICQGPLLENHGEVVERGVTVSIDLTRPPEAQFLAYRDNYRTEIRRLMKTGFRCEKVGAEYLDEFIRIYQATMNRTGAEDIYYFDKSYYEYLMREMPDVISLFVCLKGEDVACAALNSMCGGIIEGLYSGTAEEYRRLSPSKFLYDEIRRWGCEAGAGAYHLGGGVGAKRDSLYDFKMGFGGREHIYCTWRYVSDQRVYDDLCREVFDQVGMEPDPLYFPRYRHPDLTLGNGG